MAGTKSGKKLIPIGQAAQVKLKEIEKKSSKGIGEAPNTRASTRQTRASAKETADRVHGESSSPEVKQISGHEKQGRVRKVESVEKAMAVDENDRQMLGRVEKSRTRACTRSERPATRRNGLVACADTGKNLQIKENCMPPMADRHWTEQQEKALQESISTIKPGVNFWRLIAELVPGKSADDCFEKFYSRRTTTRAAKRFRASEEPDSALTERNGTKRAKSIVKTPVRKARETRQAATGPVKQERRGSCKGHNADAFSREPIATETKVRKRKLEAESSLPDAKRIKAAKPTSVRKANNGRVTQRERKGSKNSIGKQYPVGKSQVRASTADEAPASEFDRSSDRNDGDPNDSDESPSAHVDDDLWTRVQEMALQEAYATTKPSANFWHLISKRVPGRSSEECFNKFYSAHPTPPRIAQRSCWKEVDCPPTLPVHSKARVTGGKKLLEAHRTVRNILRRQQVDDEDYEADAFAALEPPDVVHSVGAMSDETADEKSTPQCAQTDKENRKPKAVGQSRDFGITQSQVLSPEILKKVKDPLMLDKYIDHLHHRRIRRSGSKSAQKNVKRAYELGKDGLDFREIRLDAIHRAKQELRDVFLRPGSAVDDPFLDLLHDSTDDNEDDDEVDAESVDSQMVL